MTALVWIQNHGIDVSLEGAESVRLEGLDRLKEDRAARVVEYARQNKPRLLAELRTQGRGQCTPLSGARCKHCVHHSVTCVCNGSCTAKGMVRDPECIACHAFVEEFPRQARRPAYYSGKGWEGILQ